MQLLERIRKQRWLDVFGLLFDAHRCLFLFLELDLVEASSVKSHSSPPSECNPCSKGKKKEIISLHYLQSGNFGNIILTRDWSACPHQVWDLIKPLVQRRGVKEKHARQSVHLPSKGIWCEFHQKCKGEGLKGHASKSLMWKIRLGCKEPNQTTVGFLGMIKAKEEPAASLSVASQSPVCAGSLLAGQSEGKVVVGGRQVLIRLSASAAPELWGTTEAEKNRSQTWA